MLRTLEAVRPISQPMTRTRRSTRCRTTLIVALATIATACGADSGVVTLSAAPTPNTGVATAPTTTVDDGTSNGAGNTDTTGPPATSPPATDPTTTLPPIVEPELKVEIPLSDVVDVDADKPEREYDPFLAVALTDIDQWWGRVFPEVYGEQFVPLEGGVYAGYPQRQTDLPGCGEPVTSYEDLAQFVAFYCEFGDFMVYDDDNQLVLAPLAEEFGPAVMGIVLAHEYGHAIQARIRALDRQLATIVTEQQADCFAGAWTGQAYRGESALLRLGDADVRAGLIAMLSVRDPVGTSQFVPGGHGSAFDRVGAFQVGFLEGPSRCSELLDDPLSLVPNQFRGTDDAILRGDAPYDCEDLRDLGFSEESIAACRPAPEFLADDLNDFWATESNGSMPQLTVTPTDDLTSVSCGEPIRLATEVIVCADTGVIAYDEPAVRELYREFGDFTLGYFYGIAWAEIAQRSSGSELSGEQRALLNDCFTGAWVRDITPDSQGRTPRQRDRDGDGVPDGITSSPGDLDEAIRMAILQGDDGANIDRVGTAFEKIAALRIGALGGLSACEAELG
jgi:predicted metalloprotease